MKILAVETSCDDTCIAVLEIERGKFKIKSNIISSQVKVHQKWGGVYPTLAIREHQRNLVPVLKKSLKEANLLKSKSRLEKKSNSKIKNLKKILRQEQVLYQKLSSFLRQYQSSDIDAIAITIGPGLEPCLWTGTNFAKSLSYYWNLPIIAVNHIEAHILANWISKSPALSESQLFPTVSLVVSGGHTQLILMKGFGKYQILGETRDDAAGECFDKAARILGLGYPGGPVIAVEAEKASSHKFKIKLPRPMIKQKNYDFSFSGLKTAILYDFKKRFPKIRKSISCLAEESKLNKTKISKQYVQEMCREIQQAVIDVLIHKTLRAVKQYRAKSIILGGGVAANNELRKQFHNKSQAANLDLKVLVPPKIFSTDNAVMVGVAAYFHWLTKEGQSWKDIKVNANLRIDI